MVFWLINILDRSSIKNVEDFLYCALIVQIVRFGV